MGGSNIYSAIGNNALNNLDPDGRYMESGHFYTMYGVAIARGYTPDQAYHLAYFTQVPDEVVDYSAFETVGRHAKDRLVNSDWLKQIQELLYSLHGGEAIARRVCLGKLLSAPDLTLTDRGLLAHAFGDAYSHTYFDSMAKEVAYGYPYGHAGASHNGLWPDIPTLRPQLYRRYGSALFNALPVRPNGANIDCLNDVLTSVDNLPNNPFIVNRVMSVRLRSRFGYSRNYFSENGNYSDNRPMGPDDLGVLTKDRVEALLDGIQMSCCSK